MEKAIRKAIEGGYIDHAYCNEFDMYEAQSSYCHSTVLLDPLFWQALGKAEGWNKEEFCDFVNEDGVGMILSSINPEPVWLVKWYFFIYHLSEGKNIDSFFNELLK